MRSDNEPWNYRKGVVIVGLTKFKIIPVIQQRIWLGIVFCQSLSEQKLYLMGKGVILTGAKIKDS